MMKTRAIAAILSEWRRVPPDSRSAWLGERLRHAPRCPVARYLLGCHGFDHGQPATAVRHMMLAHHAEPDFQSAALLVFSGLNWIARPGVPLLTVLLDTWEEFRRPAFDRYARERALLDALLEDLPGLASASALAQRLWRLPIQTLRAQIRQAVADADTATYPLLLAPA